MTWEQAVEWLRQQPEQQQLVRACFFDDPLLEAAERYALSEEWRSVQAFLPAPEPGQCVLDVGAGRGIASYALAKDGWQVTALEPDPSSLVGAGAIRELARQSGLPITVVQDWGELLPFADASFDVIHARQVLHHARNLPALCAELARVLKPGGVFVATREHVIDTPEGLAVFRAHHPLHNLYGGESAFRLDHYLDAITDAGLLLDRVLLPFQNAVNHFPMTQEELVREAKKQWPWEFELNDKAAIACFAQGHIPPGRLYSFVAHKPGGDCVPVTSREVQALASQLTVLQAKVANETAVGMAQFSQIEQSMTTIHNNMAAVRENIAAVHESITAIHHRIEALENNYAIRLADYLLHKARKFMK